jgi:hypothetical protein
MKLVIWMLCNWYRISLIHDKWRWNAPTRIKVLKLILFFKSGGKSLTGWEIGTALRIVGMVTQVNSFVTHFVIHFFQSFTVYTAVYQQKGWALGVTPQTGRVLDLNREPALQIAIDCLGSRKSNLWFSWGTVSTQFINIHTNSYHCSILTQTQ